MPDEVAEIVAKMNAVKPRLGDAVLALILETGVDSETTEPVAIDDHRVAILLSHAYQKLSH